MGGLLSRSGVHLVGLLCLTLPGGCTWQPPPPGPQPPPPGVPGTYTYECPGGYRFSVRVHGDSATIVLPDRTLALQQVQAGAGVRYGGDGVLFWSLGREAVLQMHLRTYSPCWAVEAAVLVPRAID